MLKVNTEKISVKDFLKKYAFKPKTMYSYAQLDCHRSSVICTNEKTGELRVSASLFCGCNPVKFEAWDCLFDMISNGDLVKE